MNRFEATLAAAGALVAGLGIALLWLEAGERDSSRSAAAAISAESAAPVAETRRDAESRAPVKVPPSVVDSGAHAAERALVANESDAGVSFVLGTVVDPQGRPVAGARVALFDGALYGIEERSPRKLREVESDALGAYRFTAPPGEGPFGVRVSAAGFATKSRNQSPGVDVPFELVACGSWIGRVRGEGAERVRILRAAEAGASEPWVRADDGAGSFAWENAPVGVELSLHVVPEQGLAFEESTTLSEPGVHVRDIELGTPRRYEALVLDAFSRRPIAGARLGASSPHGETVLATSDSHGRLACEIQGPAAAESDPQAFRSVLMSLSADGYLVSETWLRLLALGAPLELVPAGRIEGRVLEVDGSPTAGATVAWVSPVRTYDSRFGALAVPAAGREVRTGADGRFALEDVPWGVPHSEIVARHGARERWVLDALPADALTPLALEIRLPEAPALVGRVVWNDWGILIGRADLSAIAAGKAVWPPRPRVAVVLLDAERLERARTTTDALGRFVFDELPADCRDIEVEGHPELTAESGTSEALRNGGRITLAISPPTRVIEGTLRAHDGQPLAQHDLSAQVSIGRNVPETQSFLSARTDHEGRFDIGLPSFEGFGGVLSVQRGWTRLEHDAPVALLDWTLPELVTAVIEVDVLGAGETPEPPRWITWRGPGPHEGGRSTRKERPVNGRLTLELPLGELELVLDEIPPDPRTTQRVTVRVARGEPGAPATVTLVR